jgi:hypothetical protein
MGGFFRAVGAHSRLRGTDASMLNISFYNPAMLVLSALCSLYVYGELLSFTQLLVAIVGTLLHKLWFVRLIRTWQVVAMWLSSADMWLDGPFRI